MEGNVNFHSRSSFTTRYEVSRSMLTNESVDMLTRNEKSINGVVCKPNLISKREMSCEHVFFFLNFEKNQGEPSACHDSASILKISFDSVDPRSRKACFKFRGGSVAGACTRPLANSPIHIFPARRYRIQRVFHRLDPPARCQFSHF